MNINKTVKAENHAFRGRSTSLAAFVLLVLLYAGLVGGCAWNSSNGYRAVFPSNYEVFFDRGKREQFTGRHAVGPRNSTDSYSTGISVTVAPEAVEGGEFDTPENKVIYLLACLRAYAANFVLAQNDTIQLDGVPANRLSFSYDIPIGMTLTIRVREEIVIAKVGKNLFTIVFSTDENQWASCWPDYEAFLKSFRWER